MFSFSVGTCSLDQVARAVSIAVDLAALALADDLAEARGLSTGTDLPSQRRWLVVQEVCLAASQWLDQDRGQLQARFVVAGADAGLSVEELSKGLYCLAWVADRRAGNPAQLVEGVLPVSDLFNFDPSCDLDTLALLETVEAIVATFRRVAWFDQVAPPAALRCVGGPGLILERGE